MIARLWQGVTPREKAIPYTDYVRRTGLAALTATPGNRGVFLFRRETGERADFVVLSLWDSMDGVRAFAGAEPQRAVFFPEDWTYLIQGDPEVRHFEVVDAPGERAAECR